jgi:hypothetical protein
MMGSFYSEADRGSREVERPITPVGCMMSVAALPAGYQSRRIIVEIPELPNAGARGFSTGNICAPTES